jgi:hypothetical protein
MNTETGKMALVQAEKLACRAFAKHVATCNQCRVGLCKTGINLRDASIFAARRVAKIDPEFAKKYANLIA